MRSKDVNLMNSIIDYVNFKFETTGRTPSYREIASKFSISSSCVSNYINEMAQRNMLVIKSGSRGLVTNKIKKSNNELIKVPVVGAIACGTPLLAEQNIERYVSIPKVMLGSGDFFILRANGDSMVEANISNGDLVIVKVQETADEGQIVVALIDDEATLKRFYRDRRRRKIRLHPENKEFEDMYFDSVTIQGVAVKVIKDLA